jgi:hypothetical protein
MDALPCGSRENRSVEDRPISHLTLREMLTDAERLARELGEHLDQAFLPKCHDLLRLVRPINGEPPDVRTLEDVTVRTQAARILDNETFTDEVFEKLSRYCQSIDTSVGRIVSEGG